MKRKFLLTLITALCLIFTCMAFACDKEQTDDAGWYDPTETVKTIYFADASYSVDRYSVITLNPNYTGDSTVEWFSSDTNVAMVIDGQVLGVSAGTATVTASADGESASCTVAVSNSTQFVTLSLSQNKVELALNKTKTVYPTVIDNNGVDVGEKFATFAFESEDQNIATVSDGGAITAKGLGSTNVLVTASYAGRTIMEMVAVEVKENVNLSFDKAETELYANSLGGTKKNTESLIVYAYENDQLVTAPEISWSVEDQTVAKIENGVITGVSKGQTTVTASYTATGGTVVTANVKINVIYSEIALNKQLSLEVFDSVNDTVDFKEYASYFGGFNTIDVTDDLGAKIGATVADGVVTIENEDLSYGERELYFVINSQVKFTCSAKVVTKYISEPEELASFAVDYGRRDDKDNYSGWFILTKDIDMSGKTVDCGLGKDGNAYAVFDDTIGFSGIFDGNGYTVFNLTNSIFGRVSKNGVIKNLSVFTENLKESGTIAHLFAGTLDNCNITVDLKNVTATHYPAIAYRTLGEAVIKNTVVEVLGMGQALGAVLYDIKSYPPKCENLYVIMPSADTPLVSDSTALTAIKYAKDEANKDFSLLDTSSGMWTLHQGVYRFTSSIYYRLDKISAPDKSTFSLTDGTLTWTAIDGADGYTVMVNGKPIDAPTNTLTGVTGDVVIQIKANGNGLSFRDSDYSDKFVYIAPEAPYVADFDSLAYEELVTHHSKNANFAGSTKVEWLEEYQGEKGVLKVTGMSNWIDGYLNFGFSINLPKKYTESGYTLRYRVEKVKTDGVEHPSVRYISVDDGFRYDNNTSHWLVSASTSWVGSDRFDKWYTEYCEPTDTNKDKVCFTVSTEVRSSDGLYGGWIIYLSFVMDGDQREYIKELDNKAALDAIKNALKENELATFDSDDYVKLVTLHMGRGMTNYGVAISDAVDYSVEILDTYQGENGVLKVSFSASKLGYSPFELSLGIDLPKTYTNGYTLKWRLEENDMENKSLRYLTLDEAFKYDWSNSHLLFDTQSSSWADKTVEGLYDTWHTEYCAPKSDTLKNRLGFVASTKNVGGWTLYISYIMDGDTTNA